MATDNNLQAKSNTNLKRLFFYLIVHSLQTASGPSVSDIKQTLASRSLYTSSRTGEAIHSLLQLLLFLFPPRFSIPPFFPPSPPATSTLSAHYSALCAASHAAFHSHGWWLLSGGRQTLQPCRKRNVVPYCMRHKRKSGVDELQFLKLCR